MILVDTFVAGLPKTKGSLTVRANRTLANSEASSHWRALMAGAVRDDYARRWLASTAPGESVMPPYPGPVVVVATFYLPVAPLAYGAGDLDKLVRNLLDALGTTSKNPRYNGGVIGDDNQVTRIDADKTGPSPRPGVAVRIEARG